MCITCSLFTGRDATTGLLVDEEAEAEAGPLCRLARRLTELHGAPQVPVQAPVLGVIRGMGSTTQLLAGTLFLRICLADDDLSPNLSFSILH